MEKRKEDKLQRLMEEAGLVISNSDYSDSGSEWTPQDGENRMNVQYSGSSISEDVDTSSNDEGYQVVLNRDFQNQINNLAVDDDSHAIDDKIDRIEQSATPEKKQHSIVNLAENELTLDPATGLFHTPSGVVVTTAGSDEHNATIQENTKGRTRKLLNPQTGIIETVYESDNESLHSVRGKKRKQRPRQWKRNKAKSRKVVDHTMRELPRCRCKCAEKITPQEAQRCFKKFIRNYKTHTEQNIYLQGCLQEVIPVRRRIRKDPEGTKVRRVFRYSIETGHKTSKSICQKAFLAIHGISMARIKRKVQHPELNIQDGRGRHDHHGKKIPDADLDQIKDFISGLPCQESHYSRSSSASKKYLGSHLNIAILYRKFREKYPESIVSYEKFRRIFVEDFNLSFGSPRKDICNTCTKYAVDIQAAELSKETEKSTLLKEQRDKHQKHADIFFKKISASEKEKNKSKLSICFDFQKNLPLPVTNIQDEYYRRQLWLHNFGIHELTSNTATMYLFTENTARKGPNEVITALRDYIERNRKPDQIHLEIFCDNCFSQNKNKFLFTFLDQLCANDIFKTITMVYPIPGHSMMPIDRDFALIERVRLKLEKVYTPEDYVKIIERSRIKEPFQIVFLEKNLRADNCKEAILKVKDFKQLYLGYIKAAIPGISSCRQVRFCNIGKPTFCQTMEDDVFKPILLYRYGKARLIPTDALKDCYSEQIKIKAAKLKDLQHLLRFVPSVYHYYYIEIKAITDNGEEETDTEEIE